MVADSNVSRPRDVMAARGVVLERHHRNIPAPSGLGYPGIHAPTPLDTHSKDARRHGETEQRLYLLNAWRESPAYTPAERAALAWTEVLTRVADTHAPDVNCEALRPHFTDKEIVDLTVLVGMINLWNRLAIGMRYVHDVDDAGPYPAAAQAA